MVLKGGGKGELCALPHPPTPGPRMVPAVGAALCKEGSHRRGHAHERKAPLGSETLGGLRRGRQDADRLAGTPAAFRKEEGAGAVKLAAEAAEMGRGRG